jgi:hypothetical protein
MPPSLPSPDGGVDCVVRVPEPPLLPQPTATPAPAAATAPPSAFKNRRRVSLM